MQKLQLLVVLRFDRKNAWDYMSQNSLYSLSFDEWIKQFLNLHSAAMKSSLEVWKLREI